MAKRIRLEWDGVCVCGKRESDGVRCKFGASHVRLQRKPKESERERLPIKRERLDLFDDDE